MEMNAAFPPQWNAVFRRQKAGSGQKCPIPFGANSHFAFAQK